MSTTTPQSGLMFKGLADAIEGEVVSRGLSLTRCSLKLDIGRRLRGIEDADNAGAALRFKCAKVLRSYRIVQPCVIYFKMIFSITIVPLLIVKDWTVVREVFDAKLVSQPPSSVID